MPRIATWNLHHMTRELKIPKGVLSVIESVRSDVLVLTEYVDRGGRADFVAALKRIGYRQPECSDGGKEPRQNQVLVASLETQEDRKIEAPKIDEASRTNFLHRSIPTLQLDVVGFRVPHYQSAKPIMREELERYWQQFKKTALGAANQRVVFIGDFNIGNKAIDESGRRALRHLVSKGFRLVGEEDGLDRALLTPELRLKSFSVLYEVADMALTGKGGLSDHPMLVVEVK